MQKDPLNDKLDQLEQLAKHYDFTVHGRAIHYHEPNLPKTAQNEIEALGLSVVGSCKMIENYWIEVK